MTLSPNDGQELREIFERIAKAETRIEEFEKRVMERFAADEKGVTLARAVVSEHLNAINGFNKKFDDVFSRKEHEVFRENVEARLSDLNEFRAELKGKASQTAMYVTVGLAGLGAVSGVAAVIVALIQHVNK